MKYRILSFITATVVLASCSSVYKSSQTPDDVYYSPASAVKQAAAVRIEDQYEDYASSSEDNYLRMKIQNHYRWNAIDDFDYWNNPGYAYNNYYGGSYYGGFSGFNPYISINPYVMNNWYSPYYSSYNPGWFGSYYPSYGYGYYTPVYVVKNPVRSTSVARPSLSRYSNRNYNNTNTNTNVQRQTLGSSLRKAFTPNNNNNNTYNNNNNRSNNNNNNTSTDRPARSYTPSSSSSSSSSSGGSTSSGGSVSRPPRH